MSRPVAGLACRIRIPVRQYQAVALLVRDAEPCHPPHAPRRRALARRRGIRQLRRPRRNTATGSPTFLDLPPLTLAGAPRARAEAHARPRKRAGATHVLRMRRPRFLTRRQTGDAIAIRKIEGREIIARH